MLLREPLLPPPICGLWFERVLLAPSDHNIPCRWCVGHAAADPTCPRQVHNQSRRSGTAGTVSALHLATCNLLPLEASASMWRPWHQQGSRFHNPHNIVQRPLVGRSSGGAVNRQSERGCSSAVWLKPAKVEGSSGIHQQGVNCWKAKPGEHRTLPCPQASWPFRGVDQPPWSAGQHVDDPVLPVSGLCARGVQPPVVFRPTSAAGSNTDTASLKLALVPAQRCAISHGSGKQQRVSGHHRAAPSCFEA